MFLFNSLFPGRGPNKLQVHHWCWWNQPEGNFDNKDKFICDEFHSPSTSRRMARRRCRRGRGGGRGWWPRLWCWRGTTSPKEELDMVFDIDNKSLNYLIFLEYFWSRWGIRRGTTFLEGGTSKLFEMLTTNTASTQIQMLTQESLNNLRDWNLLKMRKHL